MTTPNFTTSILVEQTPHEVFNAVNNVRGWWSEDIEGGTDKLNDEFLYRYKDVHISKMKLTEVIADTKVVWLVLSNYFKFTQDKNEWTGNRIVFEITEQDGKTQLKFTQEGLVPAYECFDVCSDAWTTYIKDSLYHLITTGKGKPNPKDEAGEINRQLDAKHLAGKI